MRNSVLALALVAACSGAFAGSHGQEDLTAIGEETIRLKALIDREKARKELNEMRGVSSALDVQPTVAWVEGIGGERAASVRMADGYMIEVKVGDSLPDGSRVSEILPNRVTVVSSQGRKSLPFARASIGDSVNHLP